MKSIREQLIEKGFVLPEDTPSARLMREQVERQKVEQAELFSKMNHVGELPRFESLPLHKTAPSSPCLPVVRTITCRLCGRDVADWMMVKVDECSMCSEEVEERVRGQMEWVHKSVPVLHIEGRPETSPEEYAKMRRR